MIRYFSKNRNRWSIFGLLLILVLGGCVLTDTKSTTIQEQNNTSNSSQNNSSIQGGQNEIGNKSESNIHIVQNSGDELAGSLSKEVSIGQIHIGDRNHKFLGYLELQMGEKKITSVMKVGSTKNMI